LITDIFFISPLCHCRFAIIDYFHSLMMPSIIFHYFADAAMPAAISCHAISLFFRH
jgi:hypothetical protein